MGSLGGGGDLHHCGWSYTSAPPSLSHTSAPPSRSTTLSVGSPESMSTSKVPSDPAIRAPLPQLWEIGKSYDIFDLLSSRAGKQGFLVHSNGVQVPINDLIGKTIGIYVVNSYKSKEGNFCETKFLIDCYKKYHPCGKFEVVLVDGDFDEKKDEEMFRNCFSKMPWLAIPFQDIESRQRFANLHPHKACLPWCAIFDPTGILLTNEGFNYLRSYGPECFPFTKERLDELRMEDDIAEKNLTSLLTTPTRDYLVDNQGRKTPARELEGKTVGLFFYKEHMWEECFPRLREIYKTLKEVRGEKFEIVMINNTKCKCYELDNFEKACEEMPWLAWPSDDKEHIRLTERFFHHGLVVMIGPNMEFIEEYGFPIIDKCGIDAYPFTLEAAAKRRAEKMREHSLESLLMSHGHQHVMTKAGEVQISELRGKTVALYFGALHIKGVSYIKGSVGFLGKLIEWYGQIKKKDDSFEIIYVSWDTDEASYDDNYSKMPWFALPFRQDTKARDLFYENVFELYNREMPVLLAFGSNGRFQTPYAAQELLWCGSDAYPFREADLFQDSFDTIYSLCHHW